MNHYQGKLPTLEEAALAKLCSQELSAILETQANVQTFSVTNRKGEVHAVNMPVSALQLLVDMLTELGEGNMVKLVPVHAVLTTQEAADLLNISRPTLIKLLEYGEISFHRAGTRRKIRFTDLRVYQEKLETQRLSALDDLSTFRTPDLEDFVLILLYRQ